MRIIKINHSNPQDFDNNILGCDCIIKFYMDGCGHCENMKGDWNNMVNALKKKPCKKNKVKVFEVNGNALSSINSPIVKNIHGFPTILKASNGSYNPIQDVYNGDRTSNDMLKWSLNKLKKNIKKTIKKTIKRAFKKKQSKKDIKKSRKKRRRRQYS